MRSERLMLNFTHLPNSLAREIWLLSWIRNFRTYISQHFLWEYSNVKTSLMISRTSVQIMVWCRQATSHYPNQYCPNSMSPCGVTSQQRVNHQVTVAQIYCMRHRLGHHCECWYSGTWRYWHVNIYRDDCEIVHILTLIRFFWWDDMKQNGRRDLAKSRDIVRADNYCETEITAMVTAQL